MFVSYITHFVSAMTATVVRAAPDQSGRREARFSDGCVAPLCLTHSPLIWPEWGQFCWWIFSALQRRTGVSEPGATRFLWRLKINVWVWLCGSASLSQLLLLTVAVFLLLLYLLPRECFPKSLMETLKNQHRKCWTRRRTCWRDSSISEVS